MNKHTKEESPDMSTLAEDARALMAATADVAGEKVNEARKRLAAALESGKVLYGRVRDKAVEGAKVADEAVHEHPYQAIGIAFAGGALACSLASRSPARSSSCSGRCPGCGVLWPSQLFTAGPRPFFTAASPR